MAEMNQQAHSTSNQARLPSFRLLQSMYPNGRPEDVKTLIGGQLNSPEFVDTCAMRMSWTLNHVNIRIPSPHHSLMLVLKGNPVHGQSDWYAIRHAEIRQWLTQILGPPQVSQKHEGIDKKLFAGHKGIIVMDVHYIIHPHQANATGHIDLWDGQSFTEDSERGQEDATFAHAYRADLWIAPD